MEKVFARLHGLWNMHALAPLILVSLGASLCMALVTVASGGEMPWQPPSEAGALDWDGLLPDFLVATIFWGWFVYGFQSALTVSWALELVVKRGRASLSDAWDGALARVPWLLVQHLAVGLLILGVYLGLGLIGGVLGFLTPGIGMIVVLPVAIVVSLTVTTAASLAEHIFIDERMEALEAIGGAIGLVRRRPWEAAGVALLASLPMWIAMAVQFLASYTFGYALMALVAPPVLALIMAAYYVDRVERAGEGAPGAPGFWSGQGGEVAGVAPGD